MGCDMRRAHSVSHGSWACLGLACVALASCGPSIETLVERYRSAVETRLAGVEVVSKSVAGADVGGGVGFRDVTLDFAMMKDDFVPNPSFNAGVIHIERLKDLTGYFDKLDVVIGESYFLTHAQQSLNGEPWLLSDDATSVELALQRASQIRYLCVVRHIEHEMPRSLEGSDFYGGFYRADAICYDLESGEQLGGFLFRGENSARGSFNYTTSDSNVHGDRRVQKLRAIKEDLRKNAEKAFWEALEAAGADVRRPR